MSDKRKSISARDLWKQLGLESGWFSHDSSSIIIASDLATPPTWTCSGAFLVYGRTLTSARPTVFVNLGSLLGKPMLLESLPFPSGLCLSKNAALEALANSILKY